MWTSAPTYDRPVTDIPAFRIVGVRSLYETGFLHLERLDVEAPDGRRVSREVVRHPGAVAVVPVDGDDVVLIRQYRAPVDETLLELPAGKLDVAGEDPAEAAIRELEEEVGLRPGRLDVLSTFYTGPGFTDEHMTVYLARDCRPVPVTPHGVEEEHAEIVRIPIVDLPGMIADDRLSDAKTLVGLLALLRLHR